MGPCPAQRHAEVTQRAGGPQQGELEGRTSGRKGSARRTGLRGLRMSFTPIAHTAQCRAPCWALGWPACGTPPQPPAGAMACLVQAKIRPLRSHPRPEADAQHLAHACRDMKNMQIQNIGRCSRGASGTKGLSVSVPRGFTFFCSGFRARTLLDGPAVVGARPGQVGGRAEVVAEPHPPDHVKRLTLRSAARMLHLLFPVPSLSALARRFQGQLHRWASLGSIPQPGAGACS